MTPSELKPDFRLRLQEIESRLGNRLKVTHLLVGLDWGGAERLLLDSLPFLAQAGLDVEVVALGKDGPVGNAMREKGLQVTVLDGGKFSLGIFFDLLGHLKRRRPHILHTHLFWPGVLGRIAGGILKIPCIISHEHFLFCSLSKFRRLIESLSYRRVNGVVSISNAVLENRRKHIPRCAKVEVIPNGVDFGFIENEEGRVSVRAEVGIADSSLLVGWVGRIDDKWKDLSNLIGAAALLHNRIPDLYWLLVGGGPDEMQIRKKIENMGLGATVKLLGERSDARRFYNAMDMFVLPSKSEGLGLALIEAMAMSVPVVATRVGGIPEVVEHEETGLLVEPADSEGLAAAVESLLKDENKRRRIGEAAKRKVLKKFNINDFVDHLIEFYIELTLEGTGSCAG